MTVEVIQKSSDGKLVGIYIHKMFTPEYCFEGDKVLQHYFLTPADKCMCKKVDWEVVRNELKFLEEQYNSPGDLEGVVDRMSETIVDLREVLFESNELLRSANSIAEREGKDTNWEAFKKKLDTTLTRAHKLYYHKENAEDEMQSKDQDVS